MGLYINKEREIMAKVKCRHCKLQIDRDDAYSTKPKVYFCSEECYNKYNTKVVKTIAKKEPKPPSDRRLLTDLILEYYLEQGVDKKTINWSLETARIKNILDEHKDEKWKDTGLTYTLKYMHDVEHVDLFSNESQCVMSLVPFYYNEAQEHYNKIVEIEDQLEDFKFDLEPIIVHTSNNKSTKKYKKIPIDSL